MIKNRLWNKFGGYSNIKGLIAREMLTRIYRRIHYLPRGIMPKKMRSFLVGQILNTVLLVISSTRLWDKMSEEIKPDQRQRFNLRLYLSWPTESEKMEQHLRDALEKYLSQGWRKEELRQFLISLVVSCS